MGLGPTGSLPYHYYCNILATNTVCVCVCVCVCMHVAAPVPRSQLTANSPILSQAEKSGA